MHRDIKPANILIGSNGQVKVADFGIARAMNAPTESNLTQAGAVMGTATYFSPEQAQGAQPDPRSDLYSLGIVMYEMVAGRPPFTGENPVSIAYKQVHDHPQPLNQLVADVPRPYEAIVAKLLAKDPKVRYATANALRDDLRRFRNGEPVLALAAAAGAARRRHGRHADRRRPATGATVPMAATTATSAPSPTPVPPPGRLPDRRLAGGPLLRAAAVAHRVVRAGRVLRPDRPRHRRRAAVQRPVRRRRPPAPTPCQDYVGMHARGRHRRPRRARPQLPVDPRGELDGRRGHRPPHRPGGRHDRRRGPDRSRCTTTRRKELQEVPNVEGQPLEEAQRILSAAGFQIGADHATRRATTIAENSVIRTDPPAGEQVEQATTINLVVSSGRDQQAVPQIVVGRTEADARAAAGEPAVQLRRRRR